MTVPVRQNLAAAVRDDARPVLELVDINTRAESVVGVAPDNPFFTIVGQQRIPVPARQMVVDSNSTAYLITLGGLAVVPLQRSGTSGWTAARWIGRDAQPRAWRTSSCSGMSSRRPRSPR